MRFQKESWGCLIRARAVLIAGEVWTERTLGTSRQGSVQKMVQNWDRSSPDVRFVQGWICSLLQTPGPTRERAPYAHACSLCLRVHVVQTLVQSCQDIPMGMLNLSRWTVPSLIWGQTFYILLICRHTEPHHAHIYTCVYILPHT